MADSGADFSQVKSSYDDVNTALENLLGNVQGGNSANYASKSDIAYLQNQLNNFVGTNPVGTILPFGVSTVPNGYLLCNGATFSQTNFPNLYSALGTSTLPDLRGMFLRGLDTTGSVDPQGSTRGILSYEEGTITWAGIYRGAVGITSLWNPSDGTYNATTLADKFGYDVNGTIKDAYETWRDISTGDGLFSNESPNRITYGYTRPKNVAVNYVIKAVP